MIFGCRPWRGFWFERLTPCGSTGPSSTSRPSTAVRGCLDVTDVLSDRNAIMLSGLFDWDRFWKIKRSGRELRFSMQGIVLRVSRTLHRVFATRVFMGSLGVGRHGWVARPVPPVAPGVPHGQHSKTRKY